MAGHPADLIPIVQRAEETLAPVRLVGRPNVGPGPSSPWAVAMRRDKRLFDRVIDFANLHRAFLGASRGKRDRPEQFARARRGVGYALHCDIQGYFARVDPVVLMGLLERRIGDDRLLGLLASLITHGANRPGTGMPIGNLTSQMFANLYLDPFDHFVKETLRWVVRGRMGYCFACGSQ